MRLEFDKYQQHNIQKNIKSIYKVHSKYLIKSFTTIHIEKTVFLSLK